MREAWLQYKPLKHPSTGERVEAWHWDLRGPYLDRACAWRPGALRLDVGASPLPPFGGIHRDSRSLVLPARKAHTEHRR